MTLFDVYSLFDVCPVKGEDVFVYDENGTQYLDLYGGHAVISIGHSHPTYVSNVGQQLQKLGFYSNSVQNKLQEQLVEKLSDVSGCSSYQLFLCNSGAEANENAIKLASFHTGKSKIVAFKNSFHGRTSAAVAATDNTKIVAPVNAKHEVELLNFGDKDGLQKALNKGDVCAVIIETIQGVGGLDEVSTDYFGFIESQCQKTGTVLIADEVQSGFGRTGAFFAFQHHNITPDIISMAKGMGNGFPVGGILIHPHIKASKGLLGTTFGGNHLACAAVLSVLEVLHKQSLMNNAKEVSAYLHAQLATVQAIKKLKGRGLMLGLEFDFPIAAIRKELLFGHQIFTGSSKNPNLLRLLPPLTLQKEHVDRFVNALKQVL